MRAASLNRSNAELPDEAWLPGFQHQKNCEAGQWQTRPLRHDQHGFSTSLASRIRYPKKKRREIPLIKKSRQPARQEAESQTHDKNQANQSNTAVETAPPHGRPNQQAGSDAGGHQQSPLLAPCLNKQPQAGLVNGHLAQLARQPWRGCVAATPWHGRSENQPPTAQHEQRRCEVRR